jgi:hypothetical protein
MAAISSTGAGCMGTADSGGRTSRLVISEAVVMGIIGMMRIEMLGVIEGLGCLDGVVEGGDGGEVCGVLDLDLELLFDLTDELDVVERVDADGGEGLGEADGFRWDAGEVCEEGDEVL